MFTAYLDSASPLHLDRVFGGTLLQSVECTECGHISQRIEPFLDISLPICNTKNNSATRIEKTASSYGKVATNSVSKHQKKKDRHAARKVCLCDGNKFSIQMMRKYYTITLGFHFGILGQCEEIDFGRKQHSTIDWRCRFGAKWYNRSKRGGRSNNDDLSRTVGLRLCGDERRCDKG